MALAKAFPEVYQYELDEPTTVRATFVPFTRIIYSFVGQTYSICPCAGQLYLKGQSSKQLKYFFRPSDLRLPVPQTGLCAPISGPVSPLLPPPQRSWGQRRRRMLRRGPGGREGQGEHPPALLRAIQKQVLPLRRQWKRWWRRCWEKLRSLHAPPLLT